MFISLPPALRSCIKNYHGVFFNLSLYSVFINGQCEDQMTLNFLYAWKIAKMLPTNKILCKKTFY